MFEGIQVLLNAGVSAIASETLLYSPWRLFCSRLVQANFRPCGCLLFLNHFDKLKDVGVWLSHCFLQARMPTFNMCIGCQSRNSSIVGTGTAYSVINWYMCCWSIRGCRLVGSVEPLPVLLAKVGEQMMGDKRLWLPFSTQIRIIGSLRIYKPKELDVVAI